MIAKSYTIRCKLDASLHFLDQMKGFVDSYNKSNIMYM